MSERDDVLHWVGSRLKDAEVALHNGDAAPRFAIWSKNDPVTVLGAWMSGTHPGVHQRRNLGSTCFG